MKTACEVCGSCKDLLQCECGWTICGDCLDPHIDADCEAAFAE